MEPPDGWGAEMLRERHQDELDSRAADHLVSVEPGLTLVGPLCLTCGKPEWIDTPTRFTECGCPQEPPDPDSPF